MVVEGGVEVRRDVDEAAGEGLDGESRREGESCLEGGEFGGLERAIWGRRGEGGKVEWWR